MLWESVGMTGYMPLLLYAIYLSWATAMNVVSSLIVDRVGRVRLLIVGVVSYLATNHGQPLGLLGTTADERIVWSRSDALLLHRPLLHLRGH